MSDLKKLNELCNQFTILYAEDELQIQEEVAKTLRRIFKEVYTADDGDMGLKLFGEHHPDMVLTDIQMPRLTGLEMAKAIKEISPHTPIIIATAFNEDRYFIEAIEEGIDSFLLKPIDKDKLFQALLKNIGYLAYQKKAKELEERQKIDEINHASEESIQALANLFPFPSLFYKNNRLIFINTTAENMLKEMPIESVEQETAFVSQFHITKDNKQKIKLYTKEGQSKAYWIHPNAFFIGVDNDLVQTYIFIAD